jgi:hypothetical protein
MVMEMGSAKLLDEACNHYNEVYSDEVLYAAWAEAPPVDVVATVAVAAADATPSFDVDAFMARLYASQE